MGYTTSTLERVMDVVMHLDELGGDERADDRWVTAQRLYLTSRTAGAVAPSTWRKLLRIAAELKLVEVRETNPAHTDQRIKYLRATEAARKCIQDGRAIGDAALGEQIGFYMPTIM